MKEPFALIFREERDGRRYMTNITATLEVHAQLSVADDVPVGQKEYAKEHLREMIMRELYEDKRRDFIEAMNEFEMILNRPFEPGFFEAKERLMGLLKRMAPDFTSTPNPTSPAC